MVPNCVSETLRVGCSRSAALPVDGASLEIDCRQSVGSGG